MTMLRRVFRAPPVWLWSFLAAAAAWSVATAVAAGHGGGAILTAALTFVIFSVLVGIGQMFVMASGPGNVDLSIPAAVALGGIVGMKLMGGRDAMIVPGVLAGLATGALIGAANAAVVRLLRVPPIIATLSMSLLVQSVAISYGRGLLVAPPPLLAAAMSAQVAEVPWVAIAGVAFTAAMAAVLHRSIFGRSVLAIGQNARAARLAGVRLFPTRLLVYMLSGTLAALCGILLAASSGGASLDMGTEYLLASIAIVVIGGTSVSGGRANLTGIWGAALFLFLLVSMLNSLGVGTGWRLVLNGAIIIAVIVTAGGEAGRS